jgi:hypothetical protein
MRGARLLCIVYLPLFFWWDKAERACEGAVSRDQEGADRAPGPLYSTLLLIKPYKLLF